MNKLLMLCALVATALATLIQANATITIHNRITSGAPDKRNGVFIDYIVVYTNSIGCADHRIPVAKGATESVTIHGCGSVIKVEFPNGKEATVNHSNDENVEISTYGTASNYFMDAIMGSRSKQVVAN